MEVKKEKNYANLETKPNDDKEKENDIEEMVDVDNIFSEKEDDKSEEKPKVE